MAADTANPGGKPEPSAVAEPYRPGQNIKKSSAGEDFKVPAAG